MDGPVADSSADDVEESKAASDVTKSKESEPRLDTTQTGESCKSTNKETGRFM